MGIGGSSFAVRQKVGEWGEDTFLSHFRAHPEYGLSAFPYGEAYSGRKKAQGDAVCRPDVLLIDTAKVAELGRRGIPLASALDLRKMADTDPVMEEVVDAALVAVEVKFSHRKYVPEHVNFIIDDGRQDRYRQWLGRTRRIGAVMVWMTIDRSWITSVDRVIREGSDDTRTYEMRGGKARQKKTKNLPVEKTDPFATVTGYVLNKTLKARFQITKGGSIEFDVEDDLGDFKDVQIETLRSLAASVRRD